MQKWRRWVVWGGLLALVVAGLVYSFWPRPVPVELATVGRGHLAVTVDEEGMTRVKQAYIVSSPIAGHARRIELEVGDTVAANKTEVAYIEPVSPTMLDARSRAQAEAAVRAAEAARALAEAGLRSAEAELTFARTELSRARSLYASKVGSKRALDEAERAFKTREAAVETAKAGLRVRESELERAKLELIQPGEQSRKHLGACGCVIVRSPVSGDVLRIFHKSAGVVRAGEQLIEVGDPRKIEIVVDLLSSDAVRVRAGQRVIIDSWGGDKPLAGKVLRVEPIGKTKVSALGIEEQRVDVVIDFTGPPKLWQELGHGFRVETRIVLWEADKVLKVPLSALFRVGDRWAVFVAADARARRRFVRIGRRTALEAEVVDGLKLREQVVVHPSDRITDGVRVVQRP
ncbi:MAG: HlyD family efflux transporter periplasmic adaptor subunit [Alphaproteobacteria bacterium]